MRLHNLFMRTVFGWLYMNSFQLLKRLCISGGLKDVSFSRCLERSYLKRCKACRFTTVGYLRSTCSRRRRQFRQCAASENVNANDEYKYWTEIRQFDIAFALLCNTSYSVCVFAASAPAHDAHFREITVFMDSVVLYRLSIKG